MLRPLTQSLGIQDNAHLGESHAALPSLPGRKLAGQIQSSHPGGEPGLSLSSTSEQTELKQRPLLRMQLCLFLIAFFSFETCNHHGT